MAPHRSADAAPAAPAAPDDRDAGHCSNCDRATDTEECRLCRGQVCDGCTLDRCERCGQRGCAPDHACDRDNCNICCACLTYCPHCEDDTCQDCTRCVCGADCNNGQGYGYCPRAPDQYDCTECKAPYTPECTAQGHLFVCGVLGWCMSCDKRYERACRLAAHPLMCGRCANMATPVGT